MQISVRTAQRFSWSRVRHRSMAAINKSRLSWRTNAALQFPQKNYAHFFPRARFKARREELHLVLFPNGERACLFAPLVGRPSPGLGLLDLALAKFQFDLTLS